MHNLVYLIGRLTEDPILNKHEENKKSSSIIIAVQRNFKNSEGIYETDFFRCILWNGLASNLNEYCKKGDLIGLKGRLQNNNYDKEGKTIYQNEIIAEKISFLSSKKKEE